MRKPDGLIPIVAPILLLPGISLAKRFTTRVDAGLIAGIGSGMLILILGIAALMLISMWKIFEKAGKPGWASIVPIYNFVVMLQISGKPEWWIILMFVPFVNLIVAIMVIVGMAEKFGKGSGFALGMVFLPVIFYPATMKIGF